jgi:ABC-type sugar transport system substrate-binding protein
MIRVVVESPCSGMWERNQDYLKRCLQDCIERGEAPIASHGLLAFSNVLDDYNNAERQKGMEAGWAWLPVANKLVAYLDYGISDGMALGAAQADKLGIPVEVRHIGPNPEPIAK